MLSEIQFSSSGKRFVIKTLCSNHFLSRITTALPKVPPELAQQFLMQPRERGKQLWLEEIENQVNPIVWAAGRPGRAKRASPVKADLKPGAGTPGRRQYPCERTP